LNNNVELDNNTNVNTNANVEQKIDSDNNINVDIDINTEQKIDSDTNINIESINTKPEEEKIIINKSEYDKYITVQEQYKNLMPRLTVASQRIGEIGENYIFDVLQELNYNPINTTHIPHSGDIHVNLNNFVVLFEIKNKKSIIKEDITKFKFDIEAMKLHYNLPVTGIFISLNSSKIQNIVSLNFSIKEIYMPRDYISKITIETIMKCLKLIHSNIDLINIQNRLNDELFKYDKEIEICDKHIDYSKVLYKDMNTMKQGLGNKLNVIRNILKGIDIEKSDEEFVKELIRKHIKSNPKWRLKDCNNLLNKNNYFRNFSTKEELTKWLNC
jgi:hypothetical protein